MNIIHYTLFLYTPSKKMLPIIEAFANKQAIQFRDLRAGRNHSDDWVTINPETTEFRLGDDTNPDEWRVTPNAKAQLPPGQA